MRRLNHLVVIVLLALPLVLVACGEVADGLGHQPDAMTTATPSSTGTATATLDKTACPVTRPPDPPFIPPSPYPASTNPVPPLSLSDESFWHGSEKLWMSLHNEGSYDARDFWKMFWWSDGYSWTEEPTPALSVTATRTGAEPLTIEASQATNGYHEDLGSFMLVGLRLPESGCWEITGTYSEQTVTVVAWIDNTD